MEGYDFEPKVNSVYLRLKSKGERVKIRLVSKPIHYIKEYEGKESDKFAWIVLDKTDPTDVRVKAFEAGAMIYRAIKELATSEDWGDPTFYDLTITRTEEKGNYYTVTPSPNKTAVTADEQAMIKEAELDLTKLYAIEESQATTTFGTDEKPGKSVKKAKISDDETSDQEVNLDDIAF